MCISLNGEKVDADGAQNVADLVRQFQLPPGGVLIEHNGVALHRREWSLRELGEGDQIEIIHVVAGG